MSEGFMGKPEAARRLNMTIRPVDYWMPQPAIRDPPADTRHLRRLAEDLPADARNHFFFDLGPTICACFKTADRSIPIPSAMRSKSSNVGLRIPRSTKLNMDCETPERCDTT